MIEPTVGRVVLFRPIEEEAKSETERHAATVACVNEDGTVNLSVADAYGQSYHKIGVVLVQDDDCPLPGQCEWMEYQKGQAAKTEAAEADANVIDFDKGADYDAGAESKPADDVTEEKIAIDPVAVGEDVLGDNPLMDLDAAGNSTLTIGDLTHNVTFIAAQCHEMNRIHCQSVGDDSQPAWEDAPEWQKNSAIMGVYHVLINPDTTPEESHLSWLMTKSAEGWKYGEVKDPEAKTHPCMVDFADLSDDHKIKDTIFINTVRNYIGLEELDNVVNS